MTYFGYTIICLTHNEMKELGEVLTSKTLKPEEIVWLTTSLLSHDESLGIPIGRGLSQVSCRPCPFEDLTEIVVMNE